MRENQNVPFLSEADVHGLFVERDDVGSVAVDAVVGGGVEAAV